MTGAGSDGAADPTAWWSEPGGPAWTPEAHLGVPYLSVFAGHVTGGWSLHSNGTAPESMPWPGVPARRAFVWSDSLAVASGSGADGFDGTLTSVSAIRRAPTNARARAVFGFATGDLNADRNSIAFERGDSLGWLRAEAASTHRGEAGSLGISGAHLWGVSGATTRGRHRVEGALAQRGYGGELLQRVEREAVSGISGELGWRWSGPADALHVRLARGYDAHQSEDAGTGFLAYSRRDAQESRVTGEWTRGFGAGRQRFGARVDFTESEVRRVSDAPSPGVLDATYFAHERAWWGTLSYAREAALGTFQAEVGGGRTRALDRNLVAPTAALAFGDERHGGRVLATRIVRPVWSDLAVGQASFLQNTWAGGFDLHAAGAARASASLLVGVTRDRAIWLRHPIEDLALRFGAVADRTRDGFVLATSGAEWHGRRFGLGASGFALSQARSAQQPRVDPGVGARAFLETRFALFQGDLGVTLRGESALVGSRESEATGAHLDGYLTSGASAGLTLGDASIVLRARNLEDAAHPETWLDPLKLEPAKGPRREISLSMNWRLTN